VASAALTPAFGLLALIGLVPAYYLFRSLPGTTRGASRIPVAERHSWPAWILAAMLLLVGAAAIFGGISLVRDGFGMPLSWLHQTPFTSWALPGIALLIGVAVPQLTALGLIVSGHRWALAGGYLGGPGPGGVDRSPDAGAAAVPRHAASHRRRRGHGGPAGLAMAAGGSSSRRVTGQAGPPPRSLTKSRCRNLAGQRVSISRSSAAWIRLSDTGPDVPSTWANRLTRSSSISQRTVWTSAPERRAAGRSATARW